MQITTLKCLVMKVIYKSINAQLEKDRQNNAYSQQKPLDQKHVVIYAAIPDVQVILLPFAL